MCAANLLACNGADTIYSMGIPMAINYFKTQGYVAGGTLTNAHAQDLAIDKLPPILRVLLSTDGTVTKSIEGFFWEPIVVENLGQGAVHLARALPALELAHGAEVIERRVRLQGQDSGDVYAYAESTLSLHLLPARAREDLLARRLGIGELLRERGLETYREILDVGSESGVHLPELFGDDAGDTLIYRSYRIYLNHRPAILVTEKFPLALYQRKRT